MALPIKTDGYSSWAGVDGGLASSLIGKDMVAAACNYSFRGAYIHTRPPYVNLILTFDSDTTETNWTGLYQGSCFYDAQTGADGFIVSRGGRLFRIQLGLTNIVSEITPTLIIVTTADFVIPAIAASVNISVNSETPLTVGQSIIIGAGSYTITNRALNQITATHDAGGTPGNTVSSGAAVLTSGGDSIILYQTNPSNLDFVYLFQAENYVIVLAGQQKPIIYDGTMARTAGIGEVPPGILGAYGWGRIWITLPNGKDFVAGDLRGSASGTASLNFIDAILKFSENDFLNEGGTFGIPFNAGRITAMQFLATQDTSLGVGVLLIGTTNMVFSVNAPVDRTAWKNLQYPIQTVSLLDYGPLGPRSTTSVNGDMWYRSQDGIRSFIVARRDIQSWGNTPMSSEIEPVLGFDTKSLLFYGSAALFDNKWFVTVSPYRTDLGVAHRGLEVIDFDLISNLRGKTSPAWVGLNTGLNILQLTKGTISGVERLFAFTNNASDDVELWEMLPESDSATYDVFTTVSGINTSITRTSIQSWLDTRSHDFQDPFKPKILNMAELFLDDIVDTVTLIVKFRPDQYPSWITWGTIQICANVSQCSIAAPSGFTCSVWQTRLRQYAARVLLPEPPETCNTIAGIPINRGHEFQFRFEQTGHARIRLFRAHGIPQQQETDGTCPPAEATCVTFAGCEEDWFTYHSEP